MKIFETLRKYQYFQRVDNIHMYNFELFTKYFNTQLFDTAYAIKV